MARNASFARADGLDRAYSTCTRRGRYTTSKNGRRSAGQCFYLIEIRLVPVGGREGQADEIAVESPGRRKGKYQFAKHPPQEARNRRLGRCAGPCHERTRQLDDPFLGYLSREPRFGKGLRCHGRMRSFLTPNGDIRPRRWHHAKRIQQGE